ncbi:MAG TPA: PaaI family thioesterase [Actinomycetota bacterium]|nr:PaaI family thioesterase [Actinomycetota bacterium]
MSTIHETLGIRMVEAGPEKVVLEMDVGPPVHQPLGLLHGGASATLAESAASIGAHLASADDETSMGTDLNISHLRAKREGLVRAVAVPVRKGRSIHVWTVDIVDEGGELVAVARCTLAIRRFQGS